LKFLLALGLFAQVAIAQAPTAPIVKTPQDLILEAFGQSEPFVSIARCESGIRQFTANGDVIRSRTNDVGLFQVNLKTWEKKSKELGIDIYTLEGNVIMAKVIYDQQGISAWNASIHCWKKL